MTDPLPPPAVDASIYSTDYYRTCCGDYDHWVPDGSQPIGGIYQFAADKLGLGEGMTIVDIGCGRGELVTLAAQRGATAIGVEYSTDALDLARQTLAGFGQTAELVHADARRIPLEDGSADAATLLDVVEHLTVEELANSFSEAYRLLRPGGRLLIHTLPNRLIYDVTYRAMRLAWPPHWRSWPADPRHPLEHVMHVNEQTYSGLRSSLRKAGFDAEVWRGDWIHTEHLPDGKGAGVYRRLARTPGLRGLGSANLFALATKP